MTARSRPLALASLALAAAIIGTAPVGAADLSDQDRSYLDATYGPAVRGEIVDHMTADERAKLHDILHKEVANDSPEMRYQIVADFLFVMHMQQCQAWSADHPDQVCPPPADARVIAGKNVADQQCNACHLFGTGRAPSFRTMARKGGITEANLAGAIKQGHQMSPMYLSAEQVKALVGYISGLK